MVKKEEEGKYMLMNMMNTRIIIYLIVCIFIFGMHDELISQEIVDTQAEDQVVDLNEVDTVEDLDAQVPEDIDLDTFLKQIYSKEDFYSPTDKRDPFKPFVKVLDREIEIQPEFNPLLPPIKRFSLSQFKLVGVMWLETVPQAMLTDPEKNTYILYVGDEIGNRQGSIVEIRENGIAVEEKYYLENTEGQRSVEIRKSILAFTDK